MLRALGLPWSRLNYMMEDAIDAVLTHTNSAQGVGMKILLGRYRKMIHPFLFTNRVSLLRPPVMYLRVMLIGCKAG